MNEFIGLRAKIYSSLIDDKKAKGTNKCIIKKLSLKIIKTV